MSLRLGAAQTPHSCFVCLAIGQLVGLSVGLSVVVYLSVSLFIAPSLPSPFSCSNAQRHIHVRAEKRKKIKGEEEEEEEKKKNNNNNNIHDANNKKSVKDTGSFITHGH